MDGLYGAIILHSPSETAKKLSPYDREVLVMMGDYYSTLCGPSPVFQASRLMKDSAAVRQPWFGDTCASKPV
jgi:hypothetical protein